MKFGEKLGKLLEMKDIKQKDFAAILNISKSTLNGYINTERQPDFELVKQMASILDVTTDYLLDYNHTPQPQPVSVKELAMLTKLRNLDKDKRNIIFALVDMLTNE